MKIGSSFYFNNGPKLQLPKDQNYLKKKKTVKTISNTIINFFTNLVITQKFTLQYYRNNVIFLINKLSN